MIFFPISTDEHDGSIGIVSLLIVGICLLFHIIVSINGVVINNKIDKAITIYQKDFYTNKTGLYDDVSLSYAQGIDSIVNKARQETIIYKLGFIPKSFNIFTIFTSLFLHGGWIHLIGNMIFFYVCGVTMEKYWGHFKFLLIYLGCGLAATLTYFFTCFFNWSISAHIPLIGASGAIAGAMGAFVITHTKTNVKVFYFIPPAIKGTFEVVAYVYFGLWFISQLVYSILGLTHSSNVAYAAHVGGFVCGIVLGKFIKSDEEASLIKPSGRQLIRRVGEQRLSNNNSYQNYKNKIEPQVAYIEHNNSDSDLETMDRSNDSLDISSYEQDAITALQNGETVRATDMYVHLIHLYMQSPTEHKDEIIRLLGVVLRSESILSVTSAQLYEWAKKLHVINLTGLALNCLDKASQDLSNKHIQKNALLWAARIRIDSQTDLDVALDKLRQVMKLDVNGIASSQALQMMKEISSLKNSIPY